MTAGLYDHSDFVRIEGLVTTFADRQAWYQRKKIDSVVRDVTLSIPRGRTLGLVGESGSGKTTLGRSVLRLVEPAAGRVLLDGTDVTSLSPGALRRLRRRMQMVFQYPVGSLNPRLTVGRIVAEPLEVHGIGRLRERDRRVSELLSRVGLEPEWASRYPHHLSGGQRQRVGIARALALDPEFLVLDEPVSALDVSVQANILNLLMDLQEELNLTYLFIAHDLAVVRHLSHTVAVMHRGKIVEWEGTEALFDHPKDSYTRALLAATPIPATG